MEKNSVSFQKVSALFGLLGGLCLLVYIMGTWNYPTLDSGLSTDSIVRWAEDNRHVVFLFVFGIIGMVFFGVVLHGICERLKKYSPPLASLSLLLGWLTLFLKVLVLAAKWFHFYFNSLVWNAETAYQFFPLTDSASSLFHVASLPFLAGWLFVVGIGGWISKEFSKLFAVLSLLFGICVALDFLSWHWEALSSLPSIVMNASTLAWIMLIWASAELLLKKN